jgi:hypothetical protein
MPLTPSQSAEIGTICGKQISDLGTDCFIYQLLGYCMRTHRILQRST